MIWLTNSPVQEHWIMKDKKWIVLIQMCKSCVCEAMSLYLCHLHLYFKRSVELKSGFEAVYTHTMVSARFPLSTSHSSNTSSNSACANDGVCTLFLKLTYAASFAWCLAVYSLCTVICKTSRHDRRMTPGVFSGCIVSTWWSGCWSCCCCQ